MVLLIFGVVIGLVLPLTWLLHTMRAPDFVVYPLLTVWVVLVLYSGLLAISVWAPVRGKKLVEQVLKTPWLW